MSSSHDHFFCRSLCAPLSALSILLFNCLRQCIAKSFTQKSYLCKGSGCAVTERPAVPTQYVAVSLRRLPRIFLDMYIYVCISACAGILILMVLISVGLASLAQLVILVVVIVVDCSTFPSLSICRCCCCFLTFSC